MIKLIMVEMLINLTWVKLITHVMINIVILFVSPVLPEPVIESLPLNRSSSSVNNQQSYYEMIGLSPWKIQQLKLTPSPSLSTIKSMVKFKLNQQHVDHFFKVSTRKRSADNQCFFDGRYYQPGSSWHPYLPPSGIYKCSLCTCLLQNSTLEITCQRHFTCPPLTCDPDQAVREHPADCCKKCPDAIQVKSSFSMKACVLLGRLYPNGHRWHPQVVPFGEIRCVKCICKNGSIKCSRLKCPKDKCSNSPVMKKCCPNCNIDDDRQSTTHD